MAATSLKSRRGFQPQVVPAGDRTIRDNKDPVFGAQELPQMSLSRMGICWFKQLGSLEVQLTGGVWTDPEDSKAIIRQMPPFLCL